MNSMLYIFLPCKKVYPIGVTYLADFIHRRKPEVRQRILDLSLFPSRNATQRDSGCRRRVSAGSRLLFLAGYSDLLSARGRCFAGACVQFLFCRAIPSSALTASFAGPETALSLLQPYSREPLLSLVDPKGISRGQIMIGGGAFTAFADQLIEKLPEGTIGILGEGEDAILKVHRRPIAGGRALHHSREGKQSRKGTSRARRRCWTPSQSICPT